jgi:HK97 family phage prohead protease
MDGETREQWMERCIPAVLSDGTASSNAQAVAVCSSMWEQKAGEGEPGGKGVFRFSSPVAGELEVKDVDGAWSVSGYVSAFNNEDDGGDVVLPGAFEESLKSGRRVRFLWGHDPMLVLGRTVSLREDKRGLFGRFKLSRTSLGEQVHQLLVDGAVDSFSFGYRTRKAGMRKRESGGSVRELKQVDLFEASLVSIPMNAEAVVTGFKSGGLTYPADLSLVERMRMHREGLLDAVDEVRSLVEQARSEGFGLNEAKRAELVGLSETFSDIGGVHQSLLGLLQSLPSKPGAVDARLVSFRLSELRKRLAVIGE